MAGAESYGVGSRGAQAGGCCTDGTRKGLSPARLREAGLAPTPFAGGGRAGCVCWDGGGASHMFGLHPAESSRERRGPFPAARHAGRVAPRATTSRMEELGVRGSKSRGCGEGDSGALSSLCTALCMGQSSSRGLQALPWSLWGWGVPSREVRRWAAGGGRAECSCLCPTRSQVRGSHTSLAWQQFGASPFLSAAQNAVCFVCEAMRAWATVSSCKPLSPTELTP